MRVRAAVDEDVEAVVRMERGIATAPHWAEGEYRGIVAGGGIRRCLFVAKREESVDLVGFAVGKVVAGGAEVESLAVTEAEQRRGLGRALLEAVMAWCRAEGAEAVELEVRESGTAARRLYERAGFTETGRRVRYYDEPVEDAVLMRWQSGADAGRGHV